jgi:hypothetical protein
MGIVDRVKNICLTPNTEWPVIAAEPATSGSLITGYAAPLIGIGVIAGLIGSLVFGFFAAFFAVTFTAVLTFVFQVIGLFVMAFIINFWAPKFAGQANSTQAMKIAVYTMTPIWVLSVLRVIPLFGFLVNVLLLPLACLYGIYLLYLGLAPVMKTTLDKAVGYTVAIVGTCIALSVALFLVVGIMAAMGIASLGMMSGALGGSSPVADVSTFDKDTPLGKLEELGRAMEKSSKELEAANNSGDANATAAAAGNMLGTLFGGGKKVDPLQLDQLKAFVPDSFAGLNKDGNGSAERNGIAGLMVAKAGARYSDGGSRRVDLEIVDSGGASGLMGMAGWAGMESQKEDDYGTERTTRTNGRWTHERDARNGTDEYAVMIADRFMVTAKSSDVDLAGLRSAVASLNLSGLERMKDVGVQKP